MPIFDQNHGLNPLQKCQFFDYIMLKCHFYSLKSLAMYVKLHQTIYLGLLKRKNLEKKCQFLTKIVGKLPLQKCNSFSTLLKLNFYNLESLVLYVGDNQTIYIGLLKRKTNLGRKCSWKNSF